MFSWQLLYPVLEHHTEIQMRVRPIQAAKMDTGLIVFAIQPHVQLDCFVHRGNSSGEWPLWHNDSSVSDSKGLYRWSFMQSGNLLTMCIRSMKSPWCTQYVQALHCINQALHGISTYIVPPRGTECCSSVTISCYAEYAYHTPSAHTPTCRTVLPALPHYNSCTLVV